MSSTTPPVDVLVVGGGITGTCAAYRLAQAGAGVVLVDRYDLGTQASGRNAGSLHGQVQHASFLSGGEAWARAWAPCLDLLAASLRLWAELPAELGVDLEVETKGGLLVAATPEQLEAVARKVALENEFGVASRMLDAAELQREAPYISPSMVGAELCPPEGKANPLLATPALARAAIAAGADVRRSTDVVALARNGAGFAATTADGRTIRARQLVCAGGAELRGLVQMLGADVAVTGEPMQVNVTEPVGPLVKHLVYFAGGPLTLKQARAGSLLIGGGWPARAHPVSGRPVVDLEGMRRNLAIAREVVPAVGSARVLRTWVGMNNATPDQRPILGELRALPGLFVGTFPYLGFTGGPMMGRLLADLVLGVEPELDLAPFAPDRF